MQCSVTFIGHSGTLVELDGEAMLFDYYTGALPTHTLTQAVSGTVFVSHSHGDHYSPDILSLREEKPSIQYVVSEEVPCPSAIKMSPGDTQHIGGLRVQTFGSTDIGVSFLIQAGDTHIFHAGDFNLWGWEEESTQAEIDEARDAFLKILDDLRGFPVDIAFFPLDPRMGRNFDEGILTYCREIKPRYIMPIHFGMAFDTAAAFISPEPATQVLCPQYNNHTFYINL